MEKENSNHVRNGLAFEYAIIQEYVSYFNEHGILYKINEDKAYADARSKYELCKKSGGDLAVEGFHLAAKSSVDLLVAIEPGLCAPTSDNDYILIRRMPDVRGEEGDVRDIVFERKAHNWQCGISAKNNNNVIKHPRLSNAKNDADFLKKWKLGGKCSPQYWDVMNDVANYLLSVGSEKVDHAKAYAPALNAFMNEIRRIYSDNGKTTPKQLIRYFIGDKPFYKLIKDDDNNLLVIEAYNLSGKLNIPINGVQPKFKIRKQHYPDRIDYLDWESTYKGEKSTTTICINFNRGWEMSVRIHTAESKKNPSLKLEVSPVGNPTTLFTTHIFNDFNK